MVNGINFSCQGESHKATDKPCQDYSHCYATSNGIAVAIVCDGHGGERYFRSQYGAKFAAEVTDNAVWSFVQNIDAGLFEGKQYTAVGPTLPDKGDTEKPTNKEFIAFRQLFSNILYRWNEKINEHAEANPLNDWEKTHVKEKYLNEFESQMTLDREQRTILEKTYGCTLMAYVQTPEYWFAFHLGDGKMIAYNIVNGKVQWQEPVPWDDRCFLNKTTSLCDSDALNEFRYCYEGDGKFPAAVFLGSDGLDDSFGDITNLVNFYIQIVKMLANDGIEATQKSLEETLPQLSKIGSKDDMSVATIFDLKLLQQNVQLFIDWQRDLVSDRIDDVQQRMKRLVDKRDSLKRSGKQDNNTIIELNYAIKDLERAKADRDALVKKYDLLADELGDRHYVVTEDEKKVAEDPHNAQEERQILSEKQEKSEEEASLVTIAEPEEMETSELAGAQDNEMSEKKVEDGASYPREIPVTDGSAEASKEKQVEDQNPESSNE